MKGTPSPAWTFFFFWWKHRGLKRADFKLVDEKQRLGFCIVYPILKMGFTF